MEQPIPEFQFELVPVQGSDIIPTFLTPRGASRQESELKCEVMMQCRGHAQTKPTRT